MGAHLIRQRRYARPFSIVLVGLSWLLVCARAAGFPGVAVGSDGSEPVIGTTHVVWMQDEGLSVLTTMVDYRGPLQPFVLLLPVPRDVNLTRVETVKHEFVARVEEVTAPRFHEFWERDPCEAGAAEQAWDEKVMASQRGFLTPRALPPRDAEYAVSNELSIPFKPIFKGTESEFRYHLLLPRDPGQLYAWLQRRGYQPGARQREALSRLVSEPRQLLLAEVIIDHAELIANEHLQLGGIRYWSELPESVLRSTLGLANHAGHQDLFIYTLHRQQRFEVVNYDNVLPPTNLAVALEQGARVGVLYNALFDRVLENAPGAFVTEFVATSDGCGEPCSNAPLQLRELMTLGGDVLEARNVSKAEKSPAAAAESSAELAKLEAEWALLPLAERPLARRRHDEHRRRLAERRALLARQKYVVSRLHYRYDAAGLPRDIELGPARRQVRGGFGVPRGPAAALPTREPGGESSRYQVRLFASHPWAGKMPCAEPLRWRWGKRWKSHSQHWRGVHIARDLPRVSRDPGRLASALVTALPELGLRGAVAPRPDPVAPPATATKAPESSGTCSVGVARAPDAAPVLPALVGGALWLVCLRRRGRRRRRERQRIGHSPRST